MIKKFLGAVRSEIVDTSRAEKLFILFAMLTGFCMTGEYALSKPTANSVFIETYGADLYPYVWLAIVPINLGIVWLYNRFVAKLGCMKMLSVTIGLGLAINLFSAFHLTDIKWLPFVFYLWKDVYILIVLQQLWSVIHATISKSRAKYLYGLIFGIGGLGSITGSIIPTLFAVEIGSSAILFFNLPFYFLALLFYHSVLKVSKNLPSQQLPEKGDKRGGIALIRNSKRLQFILIIVVLMQVTSNLFAYQFNHMVERTISDCDLRTAFYGKFWGIIHTVNLCLQFVGSFLCVQLMGLKRSHLFLPLILLVNSAAFLAMPTLAVMCMAFGTIKAFDYSLFAILKEMLYVPLRTEEKFKAKAVIDVFAYRSSKALASCLVLFLPFAAISWGALLLFCLWACSSVFLLKEDASSASVAEEKLRSVT